MKLNQTKPSEIKPNQAKPFGNFVFLDSTIVTFRHVSLHQLSLWYKYGLNYLSIKLMEFVYLMFMIELIKTS